jgi:hypothetical protein
VPLPEDDYEDVRKAIQPGLTAAQLPDHVIGRRPYAGVAEYQLLHMDPQANTRTVAAEVDVVRDARILLVAANIIERLPFKRRERNGPYEYVAQGPDPETAANSLRAEAYLLLAQLPGVRSPQWVSSMDAPGGRGDVRAPTVPILSARPGIG